MNQEEKFNNASQLLKQAGYTLSDFMRDASKYNSSLVQMKDEDLTEFQRLYDEIDKGNLSRGEKGKKLEELTTLLFEKSVVNLLQVYKNCRTSTNFGKSKYKAKSMLATHLLNAMDFISGEQI